MRSQRGLKSIVNNPHSNEGNPVRFKLQQRIVTRNSQSLMTNLLLGPATAKDVSKDFTITQVDLLNKFLPVVRDYFLHLIQTKHLTNIDAIKKSLKFLPQHFGKETYWITGENYQFYFGKEFQSFYNNFLADKIADKFAITLMTLIDMRELLGHSNAQEAFEMLTPLSEAGIAQVTPFATAARAEMAKQVVMNPSNFFDVNLNNILSVSTFETFTDLPENSRDTLLTQDLLTQTIIANKELAYIRLDNAWPDSDTDEPYRKQYWTVEKRISILSHVLTAEEIARMPQTVAIVKDSLFDLVQTHYGRHTMSIVRDIRERTGFDDDKVNAVFTNSILVHQIRAITQKKNDFNEGRHFGSITHPSEFDAEYPICPETVAHNHAEIERGFNALSEGQSLPDDLYFIPFSGRLTGLLPCPPVIPAKPVINNNSEILLLIMFIAANVAVVKFALSAIRAHNQNNKYEPVATEEDSQPAARPGRVIGLFQRDQATIKTTDSEDEEENTAVEKTSFYCSRRNRG